MQKFWIPRNCISHPMNCLFVSSFCSGTLGGCCKPPSLEVDGMQKGCRNARVWEMEKQSSFNLWCFWCCAFLKSVKLDPLSTSNMVPFAESQSLPSAGMLTNPLWYHWFNHPNHPYLVARTSRHSSRTSWIIILENCRPMPHQLIWLKQRLEYADVTLRT